MAASSPRITELVLSGDSAGAAQPNDPQGHRPYLSSEWASLCRYGYFGYFSDPDGYTDLVLGILRHERGEYEQATDHLQRALAFAQTLGDPRWEAYGLLHLGMTARARSRHDQARRHLERSLRLFEQAGDRHGASRARQVITSEHEHPTGRR
jgi:tetratricopeptide (TPR) repeat protein